jgi:hypothetical protein
LLQFLDEYVIENTFNDLLSELINSKLKLQREIFEFACVHDVDEDKMEFLMTFFGS